MENENATFAEGTPCTSETAPATATSAFDMSDSQSKQIPDPTSVSGFQANERGAPRLCKDAVSKRSNRIYSNTEAAGADESAIPYSNDLVGLPFRLLPTTDTNFSVAAGNREYGGHRESASRLLIVREQPA